MQRLYVCLPPYVTVETRHALSLQFGKVRIICEDPQLSIRKKYLIQLMLVRQNQCAIQILNYPVLALFKSDICATLNLSFKTVA